MDEPLSKKEELALRLHNFVCEFCQQFQQQLQMLRSAIKGTPPPDSESDKTCGIAEAEQRAKQRVKERLNDILKGGS